MRIIILLLLLYQTVAAPAQEPGVYKEPSKKALAYRDFRASLSTPPYELIKVKALIKKIKDNPDKDNPDMGASALTPAVYDALPLRGKFTYTMIHPEIYSQNCAVFPMQPDEENKIFGQLISWMDESTWSDRQLDFLRSNKDSVMYLIKESVNRSNRMGVNYKDAVVEADAWEMIPFLVHFYTNNKKDKDVLTTLMLLMKKGQYSAFIHSPSYKKLYGAESNYETALNYNKANETLILERASGYYELKKKK